MDRVPSGAMRLAAAPVALCLLLTACSLIAPEPTPTGTPIVAASTATPVPARPEDAAAAFFAAWQAHRYDAMYDLVSSSAQAATPRDMFVRRYANIASGIGETRLQVTPSDTELDPSGTTARATFTVTRTLAIFGEVSEDNALLLVQEGDHWRIGWDPGAIFANLNATSTVRVLPDTPKRGRILDRTGVPLADNGSVLAIGVVPGQITDEAAMVAALSGALGLPPELIKSRYAGGQPTWFMPITQRPESERPDVEAKLDGVAGVSLQDRPARVYPIGPAAAHLVGYIGHPTADELRTLSANGYDGSDWIGRSGVEAWGEKTLAGTRGGAIQIANASGDVVRVMAQKKSVPGEDIRLSVDAAIQNEAMQVLGDRAGSAVVMDPKDASVLALASTPSFDPNEFVTGISDQRWQELNGPSRPLLFRAVESAYPTGSVFKVITMAAGLENGVVTPQESFDCGPDWHGLPGVVLHNWQTQGTLKLSEALTESCNPAFYEIGARMDRRDPQLLPNCARQFGLGSVTGTLGVSEIAGTVPDPQWKQTQVGEAWTTGDGVNLAIGQGYLLATPLQVANAYRTLAEGSLVSPGLVPSDKPHLLGSLDLAPTTSSAILEGMQRVTSTSAGTASYAFRDEKLPIAAKTGSAENENPDAHAWFVGYTPPLDPRLLVLIMIEGGQHGGTVAAPVARALIDYAYAQSR
ncbi:MAG: penicillin-binding protein 2 [Chloroflexota bacterium]